MIFRRDRTVPLLAVERNAWRADGSRRTRSSRASKRITSRRAGKAARHARKANR